MRTLHHNRTNRYDDLSDLVGVLDRNRPDAVLVATVLIGLAEKVLNVPDRVKPFVSPEEFAGRVLPRTFQRRRFAVERVSTGSQP